MTIMTRSAHLPKTLNFRATLVILSSVSVLALSSCTSYQRYSMSKNKDPRLGHYFGGQGYGPRSTRYVPPAAAKPGSDITPVKEQ